jgi:DNA-binding transcriptional LysR family regulator
LTHNDNWDDLRFVLAVAEGGSVSAAARALGVNHATVLRRVAAFEERHGLSLFEKGARGYSIPPDRIKVIEAAREVEAAMAAVRRMIEGRAAPYGARVRVTTTDTFSMTIMPRILAAIAAEDRWPGFDLLTSNAHLDFARLHADITVRPAVRLPDDMAGEKAGELAMAAYGQPGETRWLGLKGPLAGSLPGQWMAENVSAAETSGTGDSFPVLMGLAEAGLGRAILPCILGDASPVLVRLREDAPELRVPIWVASHADLAAAPRLSALRGRIAQGLARHADALAGVR